jgi:hypothetical protein
LRFPCTLLSFRWRKASLGSLAVPLVHCFNPPVHCSLDHSEAMESFFNPLSESSGAAGHPGGADRRAGRAGAPDRHRAQQLDPHDGPGVRLVRLWANALVSPPERMIHASKAGRRTCGRTILTCATSANRTRICRRPSTGCGWNRPRLLEDARQGQRLQASSTSRRNTFTRRWPRRPSAPAAAISRGSSIWTRVRRTGWTGTWR